MPIINPIGNEWNPPAAAFGGVPAPVPPPVTDTEWWMRGTNFGDSGNEDQPWDEVLSGSFPTVFGSFGSAAIYIRKVETVRTDPPADNTLESQEFITDEVAPEVVWTPGVGPDQTQPTVEVFDAATGRWRITLPSPPELSDWSGGVLQIYTDDPGLRLVVTFTKFDTSYASAAWEYQWV